MQQVCRKSLDIESRLRYLDSHRYIYSIDSRQEFLHIKSYWKVHDAATEASGILSVI